MRISVITARTFSLVLVVSSFLLNAARGEEYLLSNHVPVWAGVELQGLSVNSDLRKLDISIPLPALPFAPKLTYNRSAYELKTAFDGWQSGGAEALEAHLPFGLTLEAGRRLDRFGRQDDEFFGLTFNFSDLKRHHENRHYGRIYANQEKLTPTYSTHFTDKVWSVVQPFAVGFALGVFLDNSFADTNSSLYVPPNNNGSVNNAGDNDDTGDSQPQPDNDGWFLVWEDLFDDNSLDTLNNWSANDMYDRDLNDPGATACFGGGNGEAQCYTDRPQNVSVSNGNLELTGLIETYTATNNLGQTATRDYTSGRIHTRFKRDFKYGRFEARIKLPTGQGTFPAFWMLPTDNTYGFWPNSGEIDIMENGSGNPSIGGAIHYLSPQSNAHTYQTSWIPNAELPVAPSPGEFNVYRIDWHQDEIRWYFNDQPYWTAPKASWRGGPHAVGTSDNAPFDQDFHIVLNLALGGSIGGAIDNSQFPAGGHKMLVDYVKVYECEDGPNACKYAD